jgi:hypothetical protein
MAKDRPDRHRGGEKESKNQWEHSRFQADQSASADGSRDPASS